MLADSIRRLRTVPGVGPITALTWALDIGEFSRFHTIKQAISYRGLCGDERSSADKMMRMPLSKQRNKHIQRMLAEAAKRLPDRATNWLWSSRRRSRKELARRFPRQIHRTVQRVI